MTEIALYNTSDMSSAVAPPSGVVVTGAGGYIGGAIVSYLLGHTDVPRVHATVRGDVNQARYAALKALDASSSPSRRRLHIFSAEMEDPGAFDEACRHCSAVIHVAAPTTMRCSGTKNAYKLLIDPAIKGIENLVDSVEKMGLKTIVFTSSMSAVQGDAWERGKEHVYTEEDWNVLDTTPEKNAYACMKLRSEQRFWELFKNRGSGSSWQRLVVLCPGAVLGAPATDVQSELVEFIIDLMNGKMWPVIPNYFFSMVHLDDVVRAHVLAAIGDLAVDSGGAWRPEGKTNDETNDEMNAIRLILAKGDYTLGLKDMVCGPVKERLAARLEAEFGDQPRTRRRSFESYTSKFRWPMTGAPKWLLLTLSLFMANVHRPLVRAYLNKPSRFDGGKVVRQLPGFGAYGDPVDGFLDLLVWVVERGLA